MWKAYTTRIFTRYKCMINWKYSYISGSESRSAIKFPWAVYERNEQAYSMEFPLRHSSIFFLSEYISKKKKKTKKLPKRSLISTLLHTYSWFSLSRFLTKIIYRFKPALLSCSVCKRISLKLSRTMDDPRPYRRSFHTIKHNLLKYITFT